jgi:hypothetical protein|tara:strand:+ start:125 stop:607 length:483 start_codon:yes stop_codon:yes gene_type:complete
VKAHEAAQLVEASELFDARWYIERYPDVKAVNINPAAHYCKYGWQMLRDPSSQFSTAGYLAKHEDIKREGMNPLLHYLRFGKKEGRAIVSSHEQGIGNKLKEVKTTSALAKVHASPNKNSEGVVKQLAETQALLEHYYIRCQELEFQKLDHKQTPKMESL